MIRAVQKTLRFLKIALVLTYLSLAVLYIILVLPTSGVHFTRPLNLFFYLLLALNLLLTLLACIEVSSFVAADAPLQFVASCYVKTAKTISITCPSSLFEYNLCRFLSIYAYILHHGISKERAKTVCQSSRTIIHCSSVQLLSGQILPLCTQTQTFQQTHCLFYFAIRTTSFSVTSLPWLYAATCFLDYY